MSNKKNIFGKFLKKSKPVQEDGEENKGAETTEPENAETKDTETKTDDGYVTVDVTKLPEEEQERIYKLFRNTKIKDFLDFEKTPFGHFYTGRNLKVNKNRIGTAPKRDLKFSDPSGKYQKEFEKIASKVNYEFQRLPAKDKKRVIDILARSMGFENGMGDFTEGEWISAKIALELPLTHLELAYVGFYGLMPLDFSQEPFSKYVDKEGKPDWDELAKAIASDMVDATQEFDGLMTDGATHKRLRSILAKVRTNYDDILNDKSDLTDYEKFNKYAGKAKDSDLEDIDA